MSLFSHRSIPLVTFLFLCTTTPKVTSASEADEMNGLPLEFRLAFMTGYVKAGLALYRLSELEMTAPHLLHPVSETHEHERMGLEKFGFDSTPFLKVSEALKANKAAKDIEPLLRQADTNLYDVALRFGGDSSEIINFLLGTIIEEYSIAIGGDKITDIGEYQDAYGFQVVAQSYTAALSDNNRDLVASVLTDLATLWLDGPLPVQNPTSVNDMQTAVEAIIKNLNKPISH
jgi:hypothetical protein